MDAVMELVQAFRAKLDYAYNEGLFSDDIIFRHFPKGCCGATCYLLAEYLKLHGIQTIYVCGSFHNQSHAWLVIKDTHIQIPTPKYYTMPNEIRKILATCGEEAPDGPMDISKYEGRDLSNGTLIDITADQFGQAPLYVGPMDPFHQEFTFDFAHDYNGFGNDRLSHLYDLIMSL